MLYESRVLILGKGKFIESVQKRNIICLYLKKKLQKDNNVHNPKARL